MQNTILTKIFNVIPRKGANGTITVIKVLPHWLKIKNMCKLRTKQIVCSIQQQLFVFLIGRQDIIKFFKSLNYNFF